MQTLHARGKATLGRRAGESVQAIRCLKMLRVLLDESWRTLWSLAEQFGVCQRTVRRDLDAIHRSGWVVERNGSMVWIGKRG